MGFILDTLSECGVAFVWMIILIVGYFYGLYKGGHNA